MANSPIIFGPNGAQSLVPGGVTLPGSTSGTLQVQPAATTTSYAVTMPATQGAASTYLQNNGSGVLSWASAATTPLKSQVRVYAPNGYGTTNTAIRTYSTQDTANSYGTDITYTPSSTLGDSFTINTAGTYAITRFDYSTSNAEYGLSVNSTQLTTAIESINYVNYIGMVVNSISVSVPATSISTTMYFNAGAVIRPHDAGGQTGTSDRAVMTITRVN